MWRSAHDPGLCSRWGAPGPGSSPTPQGVIGVASCLLAPGTLGGPGKGAPGAPGGKGLLLQPAGRAPIRTDCPWLWAGSSTACTLQTKDLPLAHPRAGKVVTSKVLEHPAWLDCGCLPGVWVRESRLQGDVWGGFGPWWALSLTSSGARD